MRVGSVAIAYNEERLIRPHLRHVPLPTRDKLTLVSTLPWQGKPDVEDATLELAELDSETIYFPWKNEHEQRNTGQDWFADYDWIIVMDPDEFLTKDDWNVVFRELINAPSHVSAYCVAEQYTYWKSGYRIEPPEDYKQCIAVRPSVRFVDKRVVNVPFAYLPVRLHHLSWARTDAEVLSKITHYAHAHELDPTWYERVWKQWTPEMEDLHPLTPPSLKKAIPCELPPELEKLNLWPAS